MSILLLFYPAADQPADLIDIYRNKFVSPQIQELQFMANSDEMPDYFQLYIGIL
jgi:hypothetical protein